MYTPAESNLFFFELGLGLGLLIATIACARLRKTCTLCGKKHPPRPANMTSVEYVKFFCDGLNTHAHPMVLKDRTVHLGWVSFFRKNRTPDRI